MPDQSPQSRFNPAAIRAGWSLDEHSAACNYSRALFYILPEHLRPHSVKLGKRRIIIEPPAEYLARLAASQNEGAADEGAA